LGAIEPNWPAGNRQLLSFTVMPGSITIPAEHSILRRTRNAQFPRTIEMKPLFGLFAIVATVFFLWMIAEPAAAQPAPAQSATVGHTFTKDTVIYVSDFELDTQNVTMDKGGVVGQNRPGVLERPRKREQHNPEAQAKKLVNVMAENLVSDLQKAGYKAQRLAASETQPVSGARVDGVFTEVDEGSRIHRAVIGFGSGQATMNLYVTLADLAHPDNPLYTVSQDDASKDKMGAVITMNPYVAAAKFVMEKNAPEKMVKKTAGEISAQVVDQMKQHGAVPPPK
jgi:uncharacterized protein DUF4410